MEKTTLTGRKAEQKILQKAIDSVEAEMVAVIGRRRVGKTFLVRSMYAERIEFELTGIKNATLKEQLLNFTNRLNTHAKPAIPFNPPPNWLTAFQMLLTYLNTKTGDEKIVIFLDELPWLAGKRSGFLNAFGFFWNSWASKENVTVVICGSAASWMIKKVVRNKGGLHNRITRRIYLQPFTLKETEEYLQSRRINMNRYQILQIYMAMGGIPHYLKEIEGGKSAVQNIDAVCFSRNGLLRDEFDSLYPALFENPEKHTEVIRVLAEKRNGMLRKEISEKTSLSEGGTLSKILEDLISSGFVSEYYTFGRKKRERLFRLTDEYSYFYLKFIENKRREGAGTWQHLSQTQTWKSWSGYTFENIALKHIAQIKKALGIDGIYSESSAYVGKGKDGLPGVQIDLLIDRNDRVINLCEIKYYQEDFILTKEYAADLRQKAAVFKALTKTKKQIYLTLLTTFPVVPNKYSGTIDNALTMDVMFE